MDFNNIKLCTNEAGEVILQDGKLMALDLKAQSLIYLPNEENVCKHFNRTVRELEEIQDINKCHTEEARDAAGSIKQQASWKDENAVKALISQWKLHEDKFKNTAITNDKVWNMIAAQLIKENPLWQYTGKQCENKFKDVRKTYTKVRDNNVNKSGQDLQTCKFYDEMDIVLREKPIIKPVAVASNLKKHKRSISCIIASSDEEEIGDFENIKENRIKDEKTEKKSKKKSRVSKELEKWALLQQEAAAAREETKQKRHEERMRRQDEAIKAYQTVMNKLLDKF